MQERPVHVRFARFPGQQQEHPSSVNWVIETSAKAMHDPRVSKVSHWSKGDTPITMTRNQCVKQAIEEGVDLLLMIDSDMWPDRNSKYEASDKPFWDSSFDFWFEKFWSNARSPAAIIAAPYCGPPPNEIPYVFQFSNHETDQPNPQWKLEPMPRSRVVAMTGFHPLPAIPTGVCLIDMRLFTGFVSPTSKKVVKLPTPYFYYQWDEDETTKQSTEDVTFSRDAAFLGAQVFGNFDAWAVHWKLKAVGKPRELTTQDVSARILQAIELGVEPDEEIVFMNPGAAAA